MGKQVLSLLKKEDKQQVEADLMQKGYDEWSARNLINAARKLRKSRQVARGLVIMYFGVRITFAGLLITLGGTFSHVSSPLVLFSLPGLGIVITFTGLTKIF